MKNSILSAFCAFSLLFSTVSMAENTSRANEPVDTTRGGTLKGAAVGGLGGAAVGHPVAGAVVGGVIGHHRRHKAMKAAEHQRAQETAPANNSAVH